MSFGGLQHFLLQARARRGKVLGMLLKLLDQILMRLRPRRPASARELFDVWCREMGAAWPNEAWNRIETRRAWCAVALRAAGLSGAEPVREPPPARPPSRVA